MAQRGTKSKGIKGFKGLKLIDFQENTQVKTNGVNSVYSQALAKAQLYNKSTNGMENKEDKLINFYVESSKKKPVPTGLRQAGLNKSAIKMKIESKANERSKSPIKSQAPMNEGDRYNFYLEK